MSIVANVYKWLHDRSARAGEAGEYSAGAWQDGVRREALRMCAGLDGKILEIGCGEGLFLAQLAEQNPAAALYGVDNDAGRLERARERAATLGVRPFELSLPAAPTLSFPDEFFDAVVCVNVFFNMPSIEVVKETLATTARICKSGGRVVFDYRNAANPLLVLKYRLARYYDETVRDLPLRTFRAEVIDEALASCGLRPRRRSCIPPGWMERPWLRALAPITIVEAERS